MTALVLSPLDVRARDGSYQLLGDGAAFAVGKWDGERFVFSSGKPLDFEPIGYRAGEAC